ncbi:MAG: hypothetical protein FGM39_01910 [Phycisphaerales bacterium]|nr:hypothetical protein [Phycisphaerales bacterium]
MRIHLAPLSALLAATAAHAQNVVFATAGDNGFFAPFNAGNAATVKYGDSGWLGGPDAPPVALGSITMHLATYSLGTPAAAGSTDLEITINNGDPSGLVFGPGTVLYSTVITGVELPSTDGASATFFTIDIPLPSVMTAGGFNNVGWSVKCRNYAFQGSFGFQVGTCSAQTVGFYTNNASFFNGTSWSLFAFGPNTCTQIAQFAVTILDAAPASCPADFNGDGAVDGNALGILRAAWGPAGPGEAEDLNQDGAVDGNDLGILLGAWGACPG